MFSITVTHVATFSLAPEDYRSPNFLKVIHAYGDIDPKENPFRYGRFSEQDIKWSEAYPESEGNASCYTERYQYDARTVYVVVDNEQGEATFKTGSHSVYANLMLACQKADIHFVKEES